MKRILNLIAVVLTTVMVSGCTDEIAVTPGVLPDHYSYTVQLSCFCWPTGPFDIEIDKGVIVSFESDLDLSDSGGEDLMNALKLENLISRVEDLQAQNPVTEDITYHPIYEFPEKVYFDMDENIADEEWGYVISEFTQL